MKGASSKSKSKSKSKIGVKKLTKKERDAAKDPNKPKRPPSAFFVFMEDFRKEFKEKNPDNKSVATVGKAGGDKWKSMTAADKAPYQAKADKRKAEYEKNMKAYRDGTLKPEKEEESDKSMSEVNNNEDDASGEEAGDE